MKVDASVPGDTLGWVCPLIHFRADFQCIRPQAIVLDKVISGYGFVHMDVSQLGLIAKY